MHKRLTLAEMRELAASNSSLSSTGAEREQVHGLHRAAVARNAA